MSKTVSNYSQRINIVFFFKQLKVLTLVVLGGVSTYMSGVACVCVWGVGACF